MKSLLPDWWPSDKPYKIIDCHEGLKLLPDNVLDCVVTSPPYWGLRDYGTCGKVWRGKQNCKHEWGEPANAPTKNATQGSTETKKHPNMQKTQTDPSPGKFCVKCNAWYGELGLEPTPDMFVNHLCDIFDEVRRVMKSAGTCWVNIGDTYFGKSKSSDSSIPEKSLAMIPSRFAIEMVNRGWILKNSIIWHKPSCLPSSATDRFTVDWEYMFFFTKNNKYYFDNQFESCNRAVWSINPKPFSGAHFACFPPALAETPVKAGCPEQVCVKCGKPREKIDVPVGWSDCGCGKGWTRGIVLDPFLGSGTTIEVARNLNRIGLGFDIQPDYEELIKERSMSEIPLLEQFGD